jgi:hypothetical protein
LLACLLVACCCLFDCSLLFKWSAPRNLKPVFRCWKLEALPAGMRISDGR